MALGGIVRGVAYLVLAGAAWLLAPAAGMAFTPPPKDTPAQHHACFAAGTPGAAPTTAQVAAARFDCDRERASIVPERILLRFELDPAKPLPKVFVARRAPFERLHLVAIDADGTSRTKSYGFGDLSTSLTGGTFKAALPAVTRDTRLLVAAIDRPTHPQTLFLSHISPGDPGFGERGQRVLVLLAALCGMLIMPILFNAAFYRVLREPFVLWHSGLTLTLMATILFNSGLSHYLFDLSVPALSAISTLIFGLAVAAGGMFARSFIEPGMLHPLVRGLLPWAAGWSLLNSGFHAAFPFVLRTVQTDLYYAAYAPVLALYVCILVDALRRGSRAAKFQLVGWTPLLVVGLIRQLGQLTAFVPPTDAMELFYVGCVFEVLATTLGVADRFMSIKHQRDRAQAEMQMLEQLSECDALTGLFNRRALEERFDTLRAHGFSALAVLDLDRFKAINDGFGHAIGDEVLRATAAALAPDAQTHAFRLGGEEFVLLLKGRDALEQAERRRLAIPTIVAQLVPGLANPVTASMGLIEVPPDAASETGFAELYERADKLLYEAKQAGRNRAMTERLQLFPPRRIASRRKAA